MTTVKVTVTLLEQDSSPIVGAMIKAKLQHTDIDGGYIAGGAPQTFTSDANGQAVMPLWPNALGATESRYHVTAHHPTTGRKILDVLATIPNNDCNLADVAELPPYPGKPEGAIQAANAAASAGYAQEWANNPEDELISTAAGGDGVDDYSSLHHAAKASAQRSLAETARAGAESAETNAGNSASNAANSESAAQTAQTGAEAALAEIEQRAGDYVTAGGSANALTATPSPAWTSYVAGAELKVKAIATNSGAATINVSGLGTKNIKFVTGDGTTADLIGGMLTAWHEVTLRFDGVDMVITSAWPNPNNSEPITIDCSAGGTITLSALQNAYGHYNLTGSPSADFNLVVDNRARRFTVNNATGKVPTVKTSGGSGITVPNGIVQELRGDGTNVVVTDFDPGKVSRWVATTQNTATNTNYWSKIATYVVGTGETLSDRLVIQDRGYRHGSIELLINLYNNLSASDSIEVISNTLPDLVGHDGFKLVGSGVAGENVELWVNNKLSSTIISVFSMATGGTHVTDPVYHDNSTWQAATPTGTVVLTSDWAGEWKTFTPVAAGDTTAGIGTYTTQIGRYKDWMGFREILIDLVWTAHTGSGNLYIGGMTFAPVEVNNPLTVGYTTRVFTSHPSSLLLSSIGAIRIYDGGSAIALGSAGNFKLYGRYKI